MDPAIDGVSLISPEITGEMCLTGGSPSPPAVANTSVTPARPLGSSPAGARAGHASTRGAVTASEGAGAAPVWSGAAGGGPLQAATPAAKAKAAKEAKESGGNGCFRRRPGRTAHGTRLTPGGQAARELSLGTTVLAFLLRVSQRARAGLDALERPRPNPRDQQQFRPSRGSRCIYTAPVVGAAPSFRGFFRGGAPITGPITPRTN